MPPLSKPQNVSLKIQVIIIFVLCLMTGFYLSSRKPLWNDEMVSQIELQRLSYVRILKGEVNEANRAPLFYVLQKAVTNLFRYRFDPENFTQWMVDDQQGQLIMRSLPVFFMSAAIVVLYAFFFQAYGRTAGVFGLGVIFSTMMVWAYWAESRPYALWFFLSSIQIILFLNFFKDTKYNPRLLCALTVVHILLSLTVVLSIIQIGIVSVLLFVFKKEKLKARLILAAVPAGICLYYALLIPGAMTQYRPFDSIALILACFPLDRMAVAAGFTAFAFYLYRRGKFKTGTPAHLWGPECGALLLTTWLMLAGACVLAFYFQLQTVAPGTEANIVHHRYWLFLAPVSIVCMVVIFDCLMRHFRADRWMLLNILILLVGLLSYRFIKTYLEIMELAIY